MWCEKGYDRRERSDTKNEGRVGYKENSGNVYVVGKKKHGD